MEDGILEKIKIDYEDYKNMVDTDFSEETDEHITPGRLKRVSKIKEKHNSIWLNSEEMSIYDYALDEAINNNIGGKELDETNKILMYISELPYDTYLKLIEEKEEIPVVNEDEILILYMDIENNKKYFVPLEEKEEFEKTHNVIVMYKTPNCNPGGIYSRNTILIDEVRREFIRDAMYGDQEEVAKQLLKKYEEKEVK